jgi:hypothetical protein
MDDGMNGWMDDGTNGWMEKASGPRRPFTICNSDVNVLRVY